MSSVVPRPGVVAAGFAPPLADGQWPPVLEVNRKQMNVPVHQHGTPRLPDASHYYVITVGADAQVSSLRFASTAATVSASTFEHLDSASISALAVLAGDAFVGSHFAIIGAEADVYAVAAILGASGVMREEMSVVAMDHDSEPQQGILWSSADSRRRVFCAHCHETFETTAGPTHTVLCAHCDNSLTIDPYFSRVRAAYLGTYTP